MTSLPACSVVLAAGSSFEKMAERYKKMR